MFGLGCRLCAPRGPHLKVCSPIAQVPTAAKVAEFASSPAHSIHNFHWAILLAICGLCSRLQVCQHCSHAPSGVRSRQAISASSLMCAVSSAFPSFSDSATRLPSPTASRACETVIYLAMIQRCHRNTSMIPVTQGLRWEM